MKREQAKKAIEFVLITFFLLGGYMLHESAKKLIFVEIRELSLPEIMISILSVLLCLYFLLESVSLA
jgi:hypothetical protein